MLYKIIQFSVKNKLIIGLMTFALILWGIYSATRLPLDAVPDITNNQVQIITSTPTLAAQETEQLVTYPIEQSLANIPGITEMRSISRFGLSVITVVFDESVDVYFARQLITEKLKEAEENIPQGIGSPEMSPVSTGLGEIYQYVIHPKKGSENKYSATDLRTMQDWVVARQLYGTPGVAEINSFGGKLKQYEVAINPYRLKAMNVTIADIFAALQKNNENTGGAYIDKKPNAYFIRGIGLISSLDDISNTVIKTVNGIPVLIKDVAEARIGSAVRYGALTYNGDKEAVGGIVMMLKGENSAEVVSRVKEKMLTIQKSLPADIIVEPFLDRTNLVDRAIRTVETNLVEGALIVILVLVLFLGNFRAGLIVASAIPLSLLFALGMMNVFGVSANLMSLGAIDFGLIVDGAVIIVEATLHFLAVHHKSQKLSQHTMDRAVEASAKKMMSSAAFGQIIILIVYLPILSLQGIEGKMFRPMAETVSFAIVGALILSLTYIPMMSALFLSKNISAKKTFADKMMAKIHNFYVPVLQKAIAFKYAVVAAAIALLTVSLLIFSRMGGEFIPQLQEGDFAVHCILPQGTSLSQSIETSMQASRILKSFPEVNTVVGKTGSAEVPTDPMPPEATDLIVTLKPKKDWKDSDKSYEELSAEMMEKLEMIPGVFFEVSQPIQMRFNELMTGVRQDVAIKIFGENIDTLAKLAPDVAKVVQTVQGATEPQIEQTVGLPQITITYDRARLASYGLNIEDINHTVSTAFAGETAGVVFEDEKKFNLVARLDSASRSSIEDVSSLFIPTANGVQIPLSQIAKVEYKDGPAQISREDGKRRIVVGFNVKDRDVESVVTEIQQKLTDANLLPPGYYYTYGGTFENLEQASSRLQIAVPVALALIFLLLYFAFRNLKDSLLIFTAIPMSAIGGVFALLIRDMPFSISAGVGFIALFGVAVLNGIVLVSTFKDLQKSGVNNVIRRVIEGTSIRLRPVLMTAAVASFGFFPMAFSTGSGAEVQRPLATVVIGGLVTATFLTLFVLPLLYIIFNSKNQFRTKLRNIKNSPLPVLVLLLCLATGSFQAQERISPNDAVKIALANNLQYSVNRAQVSKAVLETKTTREIPKTGIFIENDDMRPSDPNGELKIGVQQSIQWPGLYKAKRKYFEEQLKYHQLNKGMLDAVIKKEVNTAFYQLWYLQDLARLYQKLDEYYTSMYEAANLRFKTGEAAGLENIAAEARMKELQAQKQQNQQNISVQQQQLSLFLNTQTMYLPEDTNLQKLDVDDFPSDSLHPSLALQHQNIEIARANIDVQKMQNKPDFSGRVFSQRLYGMKDPITGFSVAVEFPIFGKTAYKAKLQAAEAEVEIQQSQLRYQENQFAAQTRSSYTEILKASEMLKYYESIGLKQADQIFDAAMLSYKAGEIGFSEMHQFFTQAIDIRKNYLIALNEYNLAVIQYNYYIKN
ncbi:CusA/CzcA family heavy metal efflux RND transporter [Chryseobacterium sp. cx-311]|uniref:CusA/CzcA family heavy metal efflux RND transporter n=1 Tax=Weeksellaceae TaxID=2762318 RepID=UPI001AE171F8|nr:MULTISPECIES: CusA/CzcA family heavy metal efflux RND transporter [Weeksellaceae]MBP0613901.1 CusA/CzcA family heavy metal efflux RND transporter [Marnyiella aurantia]MDF0720894.1 CusA/CzcA family heavy metal efflux RND transporter [Kaistella sp. PBT33-4]